MNEKSDIGILRELAKQKAEIAFESVNDQRKHIWTQINDLQGSTAAIYINEIPWHEMNVEDELTLKTEEPFYREIEKQLRQELYSWRHMPGDMIVTSTIECPIVIEDSGFGIEEVSDLIALDDNTQAPSRHFHVQISDEEDINKIKNPVIEVNDMQTEENYQLMRQAFDGILDVHKVGQKGMWFTPWDYLIRYTGVEAALMDLIINPEYIDKLVERYVDASIMRLERYEELE